MYHFRAAEHGAALRGGTLLNDGMIYNDILEKTGASSATISRVNRSLIYGNGGYESVLEKMKEKEGK